MATYEHGLGVFTILPTYWRLCQFEATYKTSLTSHFDLNWPQNGEALWKKRIRAIVTLNHFFPPFLFAPKSIIWWPIQTIVLKYLPSVRIFVATSIISCRPFLNTAIYHEFTQCCNDILYLLQQFSLLNLCFEGFVTILLKLFRYALYYKRE